MSEAAKHHAAMANFWVDGDATYDHEAIEGHPEVGSNAPFGGCGNLDMPGRPAKVGGYDGAGRDREGATMKTPKYMSFWRASGPGVDEGILQTRRSWRPRPGDGS